MIPKNFTTDEVYNNALIGLTFEFLSSKHPNIILEEIGTKIGKKITLTEDNNIKPIYTNAILLKEYNSKKPRYQLKLSFQEYNSMENIIDEISTWITKNGELNENTQLKTDLMFNNKNLQTLETISTMSKAKLILQINEEEIYKRFPNMKNSSFALSIKNITPFENLNIKNNNINTIDTLFNLPKNDYYAIDFSDQVFGILKFKYIGGKNYTENTKNIKDTIKYYIAETYKVLNINGITHEIEFELNKLNEKLIKFRKAYYEFDYFLREFKNVKVSVDLKESELVVKTYWNQLRNPLIKLLMENNLTKGQFNYDTNLGIYELNKAILFGGKLSDINLINCEISGLLENCNIWSSKLKNSRIYQSTFENNNYIENSMIQNCRADRGNIINKSYIINNGEILNCKINESVIKNAGLGKNSKLDEKCIVIMPNYQKPQQINKGIEVDEYRNYKWIKNLTKNNELEKGFANEFKIKY